MGRTETSNSTAGFQNWRHVVFLHWSAEPERLQARLPKGLTVETYNGSAWLAVVPFAMENVRPWWSPAVPGVSWFLETNVRTYVRHECGLRGVWFFSLDANNRIAVRIARTFWHLNYIDCKMKLQFDDQSKTLKYTGQRTRSPTDVYDITFQLPDTKPQPASEESLEHFLLERYSLVAQARAGHFMTAEVMHPPYEFVTLNPISCHETYTSSLVDDGENLGPPSHAVYSPGVDVRVSALQRVK